jgi:hypothetical protein
MEAPTGRPRNPIQFSADASAESRQPADSTGQLSNENSNSIRSPYAPKEGQRRSAVERRRLDQYETCRPPAMSALASHGHDEALTDLKRLAASLRRARREQPRSPRAAPELPSAGESDSVIEPPSLEPERLVPPAEMMRSRRNGVRWLLACLIAGMCLVPIAYYFWNVGRAPSLSDGPSIRDVAVVTSLPEKERELVRAQGDDSESLGGGMVSSQRTVATRIATVSEGDVATSLGETGVQPAPPNKAIRVLNTDDIELLRRQGEQFASAGDFVAARVPYQRAAEAGDARAATALGATYDPTVLAKLGALGIGPDVEKARFWYKKAMSLGSSDAQWRLELLANR